jgi:hypothetical protein
LDELPASKWIGRILAPSFKARGIVAATEPCFVIMPFGRKQDATGKWIDFDRVYKDIIKPAVSKVPLEDLRADQEQLGGIIHKSMFERLTMSRYSVADLTAANANVFYELGVRHAARPYSTVLLLAAGERLPFDVQSLRCVRYGLNEDGTPSDPIAACASITQALQAAAKATTDSPVFQLVDGFPAAELDPRRMEAFREQARTAQNLQEKIAGVDSLEVLKAIEGGLGTIANAPTEAVMSLFIAYRDAQAWPEVIRLADLMFPPLRESVRVREQLGMALNRDGQGDRAERVLLDLIQERGPSNETLGILGRVYKDRWKKAREKNDLPERTRALLDKAIETYQRGFEVDWRDPYPGVNVLTLMEWRTEQDGHRDLLFPAVMYAATRQAKMDPSAYWPQATLLELSVLAQNESQARKHLGNSLAVRSSSGSRKTTVDNLQLIREAREGRGLVVAWADAVEQDLRASL